MEHKFGIFAFGKKYKSLPDLAREYDVKYATLRNRIKYNKMSYEDAVKLPVKKLRTGEVTVKGKTFKSFEIAAKTYNKNPDSVRHRFNKGLSAEEAILGNDSLNIKINFEGREHNSVSAFAKFYNMNLSTIRGRIRKGWSLEDIVYKPIKKKNEPIYFQGATYSLSQLCNKMNLSYKLVYKRLKIFGWSIEDAIRKPTHNGTKIKVKDRLFPSINATAEFYKIDPKLLQYRLSSGWPIEKAIDPNALVNNRKSIVIDKEEFLTYSSAARYYNLNENTFMRRLNNGWSPEQAAGITDPPIRNFEHRYISVNEYKKRLHEIHGDNLDFSIAKFTSAQKHVDVICTKGNGHPSFPATPNNLLRGKGCPICKLSHGARKVSRWLDKEKINYEVEWTGHGLKSETYKKAVLRMDFHLPKQKVIIEFDGPQHETPTTFGKMSKEQALIAFDKIKLNDQRKDQWALKNDYKMIRIKFNELINERLEKELSNT